MLRSNFLYSRARQYCFAMLLLCATPPTTIADHDQGINTEQPTNTALPPLCFDKSCFPTNRILILVSIIVVIMIWGKCCCVGSCCSCCHVFGCTSGLGCAKYEIDEGDGPRRLDNNNEDDDTARTTIDTSTVCSSTASDIMGDSMDDNRTDDIEQPTSSIQTG